MSRPSRPAAEPSALRRGLAVALLGLMLVTGQAWLTAHELEHLFHEDEELCSVCVVGLGFGAPLPASVALPAAVATFTLPEHPGPGIAPVDRDRHPQAARAPPARTSIPSR